MAKLEVPTQHVMDKAYFIFNLKRILNRSQKQACGREDSCSPLYLNYFVFSVKRTKMELYISNKSVLCPLYPVNS